MPASQQQQAPATPSTPHQHHHHHHHKPAAPSTIRVLDTYRQKYLGIDMVLKTLCYALRLRLIYTTDTARKAYLDRLILSIIDCRMLCNSMKELGTGKNALHALQRLLDDPGDAAQSYVGTLTFLSFFFRVFENLYGDLGYLQKNWFHQWDRYAVSRRYKMWKTFSLVCCALLEIYKLRGTIRDYLRRALAMIIATPRKVRGHIRRISSNRDVSKFGPSPTTRDPPGGLPGRGGDDQEETASIITTPVPQSPATSFPPESTSSTSSTDEEEDTKPSGPLDLVALTRQPQVRSALFLTRNIADLIVYSQWIDSYNPPKTLEYACGTLSGFLGALLVYYDTRADLETPRLP